jgi:hypothetical protein
MSLGLNNSTNLSVDTQGEPKRLVLMTLLWHGIRKLFQLLTKKS